MQKIRPDLDIGREYSADALSEQAHTGSGDRPSESHGNPDLQKHLRKAENKPYEHQSQ